MQITVRLFATLRDRAGTGRLQIDIPEPATVGDVLSQLVDTYPALAQSVPTALIAVNQEYSQATAAVHAGDEVALFPPVSGGSSDADWPEYFAVTPDRLNFDTILASITRPETGAVCVFSGAVRGKTSSAGYVRSTSHLEYESYVPMAEKTLKQVAAEIREQYPKVQGIAIVQRIGMLQVGETTIFVACAAGHRDDGCFEGARYGIDRVKEIVPVWKKEVSEESEFWVEGHYRPPTLNNASTEFAPSDIRGQTLDDNFVIGCRACGSTYPIDSIPVSCTCGAPLEIIRGPRFDPAKITSDRRSMWRYQHFLLPDAVEPVTMGEGWSPLVAIQAFGRGIHLKLENLNPSGAFKDRGAATLVSLLKTQGITSVHDDSSGNAGAALAAYAARASMTAKLFIPETSSPIKLGQIRLYGAELVAVPGPRSAARDAARGNSDENSYYASHIDHPFAVFAYKSVAYELWEQLGGRSPDAVVLPLGHGSLLLGLARGFEDLLKAGQIAQMPRLYGVQARGCTPILAALHGSEPLDGDGAELAEGIRIAEPVRAGSVVEAIKSSKGDVLAVTRADILEGLGQLARRGLAVEPTSAVIWSALAAVSTQLPQSALITAIVTGSGLKYPDLDSLLGQAKAAHSAV